MMALLGLQLMGVLFVPTYLSLKKLLLFVKRKLYLVVFYLLKRSR